MSYGKIMMKRDRIEMLLLSHEKHTRRFTERILRELFEEENGKTTVTETIHNNIKITRGENGYDKRFYVPKTGVIGLYVCLVGIPDLLVPFFSVSARLEALFTMNVRTEIYDNLSKASAVLVDLNVSPAKDTSKAAINVFENYIHTVADKLVIFSTPAITGGKATIVAEKVSDFTFKVTEYTIKSR